MTRLFLLVVTALWLNLTAVSAQQQVHQEALPPAGLSQQQFDALVEAISAAVARKLKDQDPKQAVPRPPEPVGAGVSVAAGSHIAWIFERAGIVFASIPAFLNEIGRIPEFFFGPEQRQNAALYLMQLLLASAAALGAEAVVGRWLGSSRRRWAEGAGPHGGVGSVGRLGVLAGADLLGLAAFWLVSYGAIALLFGGTGAQAKLALAVLSGLFAWRLYVFVFRAVLRPDEPGARLIRAGDEDSDLFFSRLSKVLFAIVWLRLPLSILGIMESPADALSAGRLLIFPLVLGALLWVLTASRALVKAWARSLLGDSGTGGRIAHHSVTIVGAFLAVIVATQIYGALSSRMTIPGAMLLTLNAGIALVMLETVLQALVLRMTGAGQEEMPSIYALIARCARVAALIVATVVVARAWAVDVFQVVDHAAFLAATQGSIRAGAMAFIAYVAWELIHLYLGKPAVRETALLPGESDGGTPTSRIATLVPLLRIVALIVVFVIATLIILSELGVDTTPLIAGVSVFGLALSFGSQALVRDIVSGMFYLADDAFRVGEYIDCGKAKGTVEGFTLRSIRLRHQNGQIHTIPFGQLGQITNFSRDWTTVKFNLKFKRDTDIERLRKAVKGIGQEMLEDEELKGEFLEPLKMQGVADILDNALVIRFKFTVRPGKPSYVQRQAVKRMVAALPAEGIDFATATVAVQAIGSSSTDVSVAGAAAHAIQKSGASKVEAVS